MFSQSKSKEFHFIQENFPKPSKKLTYQEPPNFNVEYPPAKIDHKTIRKKNPPGTFISYRSQYNRALKIRGYNWSASEVSRLAAQSWKKQSKKVKSTYKALAYNDIQAYETSENLEKPSSSDNSSCHLNGFNHKAIMFNYYDQETRGSHTFGPNSYNQVCHSPALGSYQSSLSNISALGSSISNTKPDDASFFTSNSGIPSFSHFHEEEFSEIYLDSVFDLHLLGQF
ncbi:hypothetical protein G9A89_013816 [Geosiphon pyriformis]|nr:hypothetical protein G9A89_013816 [Geosiphon pyriformis]